MFCLNMGFSCALFINSVLVIYFASADIRVKKNNVELSFTTEVRNWTLPEALRFQLFYGMHLDDCVIECGLRKHCDLLIYNAHVQLCELFRAGGFGRILSTQSHWIHVRKQDINVKKTPCVDECNATEACDWKAVSPRCTNKECIDLPPIQNGRILGNVHGIGSRIRFKCNHGWKPNIEPSSVCLANGQWNPIVTCSRCPLGHECSSAAIYCCADSNAECRMDPNDSSRNTCQCQDAYYQEEESCVTKIETGQPCPMKGLHESCLDPDAICEFDSPAEKAKPKCISKLQINTVCNRTKCTDVNNARCVSRNDDDNSECYCKPHYEYNETLKICVEFCKNYSTNGTRFDKISNTGIPYRNLGSAKVTTYDQCVDHCNTNHPAYLSINYHDDNRCVCNKLSLRQYNRNLTEHTSTFYDRACETYP